MWGCFIDRPVVNMGTFYFGDTGLNLIMEDYMFPTNMTPHFSVND